MRRLGNSGLVMFHLQEEFVGWCKLFSLEIKGGKRFWVKSDPHPHKLPSLKLHCSSVSKFSQAKTITQHTHLSCTLNSIRKWGYSHEHLILTIKNSNSSETWQNFWICLILNLWERFIYREEMMVWFPVLPYSYSTCEKKKKQKQYKNTYWQALLPANSSLVMA